MTYNFDPDSWYERERQMLDALHRAGEISAREYKNALSELERRYDEMLDRLDGTYQLPE